MASIQPVEKEAEVNLITQENNQPQNIDTDSVSVKVDNHDSESPSIENKRGSFLPKPINYVMLCLLSLCLAPVAYACVTAATVGILPVLLAAFLVVRFIQFFTKSENFDQHFLILILLRYWIFVVVILLLLEAGLFYPIAKYFPGLKAVLIIGLPITKWIKVICILIGIYLVSQVVWLFLVAVIIQVVTEDDRSALVVEATSEIVTCLLLRWADAVIMNSVPIFKQSKVFGVRNQKWIEVILYVFIGYNIITLLTHIFVWSLPKLYGDHLGIGKSLKSLVCCQDLGKGAFNKRYVVYIACGVKTSIIFILTAVMLLLTWVLHFGHHLNTTSQNKDVLIFGTWTLVCVLICSFLWLIKSCILLFWEAHTVYDRLNSKISDIGKQLYLLVLLSYNHYERVFESSTDDSDDSLGCGSSCSKTPPKKKVLWTLLESSADGEAYKTFDRKIVRNGFMNPAGKKASVYDIEQAVQCFLSAQYLLSKDSFSTDLHHLQSDNSEENNAFIIEKINSIFGDEDYLEQDWKLLLDLLPAEHTKEDLSFHKVKTWMERAHSRCRFLANTIISEKDVVRCLNQVISGLIIVVTFITWLLLTGLATTNVLVLIGSPFLAATFIFGDTCKNLFQGLIFVYVIHPFDVGDLCVIDNKLLEVKRIGVWSSIFSKVRTVGKHQEEIYPNSVLATKNVINHKSDFDWDDSIQFSLSSSDKETTKIMKKEIVTYLDAAKDRFIPNFHSVEFLEIGEKIKIVVHIKHSVQTEGWTYFECLKEKERRRFEFVLDIQNLISLHETKTETPGNSEEMDQQITGDN